MLLYAFQVMRYNNSPTFHRPHMVELADVFQHPVGNDAHPKALPKYSTRMIGEELTYTTRGEVSPFEVKIDFYLPLPIQLRLTEV